MKPPRKYSLRAGPEHRGKRLDQVLAEWLPEALGEPVSKAKVRKLVVAGAVYLNGSRVRIASKVLVLGARVDAFVDREKLLRSDETRNDRPFSLGDEHVLFHDAWLIAVAKPPGLPTQPTVDEARDNLFAAVKRYVAHRQGVVAPYVGLHHRLDRDTSGVVLFTLQTEANAGTGALFSEHLAQKTYEALTRRPSSGGPSAVGDRWTVKNFLAKLDRGRFGAVRSGGDPAETDFELLGQSPRGFHVRAMPKTGRTHQIRVHLSEAGMPIWGDATYAGQDAETRQAAPRLMLHAAELRFPHPITREQIVIRCPLPQDFEACLKNLRG